MLLAIIKQFNWVDIVLVFLFLKITYVSAKNGFVMELFKFLGTVFSIYISFHYFVILSDIFTRRVPEQQAFPWDFMDFLACVMLLVVVYLLFAFLRRLFCHFVKMEAVPALSRWGGLILGIGRGIIISSLMVFLLFISTIGYLSASAKGSSLGKRLFNVSISTYTTVWDGIMSKLVTGEKFNNAFKEIQQEYFKA
jgi:uncharacterized membrane protein required for colicin V production